MQKSWRWFFIGRLAIMLAFTPEVRSAEVKVPIPNREPATVDAKRAQLVTQGSAKEPKQADEPPTRSYAYQTLMADVSSVVLLASAEKLNNGSLAFAGLLSYLVASPVIHGRHNQPRVAAESFLLRLGLPVLFGVTGMSLAKSDCKSSDCGLDEVGGAALGAAAGAIGASVIDMVFLAREPMRKEVGVSLALLPTQQGATLAMGGRF